jgi:hypothetical protein
MLFAVLCCCLLLSPATTFFEIGVYITSVVVCLHSCLLIVAPLLLVTCLNYWVACLLLLAKLLQHIASVVVCLLSFLLACLLSCLLHSIVASFLLSLLLTRPLKLKRNPKFMKFCLKSPWHGQLIRKYPSQWTLESMQEALKFVIQSEKTNILNPQAGLDRESTKLDRCLTYGYSVLLLIWVSFTQKESCSLKPFWCYHIALQWYPR